MGRVWGEQFLAGGTTQIADIATFTLHLHNDGLKKNFLSNVFLFTFVNTKSEEDGFNGSWSLLFAGTEKTAQCNKLWGSKV